MKGDFSRVTFDPAKHFSGVRMQQGRVQLDADWNESVDILRHRIETETIDVIGECGVPMHDDAFEVLLGDARSSEDSMSRRGEEFLDKVYPRREPRESALGKGDFLLSQGRAYVDGIMVENDRNIPFSRQPFILPQGNEPITKTGIYLLYLDVWERHITALEDISIRETALGGPDTATRTQVIWQAFLSRVSERRDVQITCKNKLTPWPDPSTGRLIPRIHPERKSDNPCVIAPQAGYKRLENQLYRVEIHKGSDDKGVPTFKWSRDNGSVVVPIEKFAPFGDDKVIQVSHLGRDSVLGLHENDWVEILDDATELSGRSGTLASISKIDPGNILTLSTTVTGFDPQGHPKVRRWDSSGETKVTIPEENAGYIPLEGGLEVKFSTGTFRTGDYWLIPARTVPGQFGGIEWPKGVGDRLVAQLPFGIKHHYCKLAVLNAIKEPKTDNITIEVVDDCRKKFPPLTELPKGGSPCCSVTVGQGGDYADLPAALNARPADAGWWTILVLPGKHRIVETITVDGANDLTICGCGRQSVVNGPGDAPLFRFVNCQNLELEGLCFAAVSRSEAAFSFTDTDDLTVADCFATNKYDEKSVQRYGPLLAFNRCRDVEIRDSVLGGLPAVEANWLSISIQRNDIMGGGIRIIPPSSGVVIEENTISHGMGPGIQLGGGENTVEDLMGMHKKATAQYAERQKDMTEPSEKSYAKTFNAKVANRFFGHPDVSRKTTLTGIREVKICGNRIGSMKGSGIITETSFTNVAALSDVEEVEIAQNTIIDCCETPDVILGPNSMGGGIAAMGLFKAKIADNFIAYNGPKKQPACGIFILEGSDIEISGNAVLENGITRTEKAPQSFQAGIALLAVFGNLLESIPEEPVPVGRGGYPAARICGNQVVCPAGQALLVFAMGSVAVTGNILATRESLQLPPTMNPAFGKAACVEVLDLGIPIWAPDPMLVLRMMSMPLAAIHEEIARKTVHVSEIFPEGRVLFADNQVSFNSEQGESEKKLMGLVQVTEIDAEAIAEAILEQATFSVLLHTNDDTSLLGNQFQATVPPYAGIDAKSVKKNQAIAVAELPTLFKFIQVFTFGCTVRAIGNYLSERLNSTVFSYGSYAAYANVTTSNETTHAYLTLGDHKIEDNNLILAPWI